LRDVIRISEKEKIKITEMCVPTNGELYPSDTACSGDIVILPTSLGVICSEKVAKLTTILLLTP
ncbi:hypothetical protein, partial [Eubacterium ramulus]